LIEAQTLLLATGVLAQTLCHYMQGNPQLVLLFSFFYVAACRAFFAKVSAWEDELVDMLEGQAGPVAIRDIVSVFKDRIHSERDKSEFKALCDKWTGVVEYPAGRWVCCGVLW
jgi:hypothetical protein